MKKIFITTILGNVTPGLLKALAKTTRAEGGEWVSNRVIKLDDRFAALMKVSVDAENEVKLKAALEAEFDQLDFRYDDATEVNAEPVKTIELTFDCNDRPGLTRDIDDVFANLELVVDNMEVNRYQVASIGSTVFSSKFSVALPENISSESVVELLEGIGSDVRVHVA
ncbi:glycine cleavage system protein R [Shewanella gelidii]|uniref:Glycine cleavage system transcriptional repressor n=1 Tax=Shewanella gelidii TaxID=1642821 RepID=A0A917JMA1_9GAMM|nr:ACT domain-containing protein [Shewanella gelidii]MCL1097099.1 transcriptional regulator [Shewanella gelidii]GGI72582.1 hypothetical protein GCM10009332_07450 [Shewanella gelidii]